MDEEKRARKNISKSIDEFNQPNKSNLWTSKGWKLLDQRRIKDRPTYGRRIMQAISQIYGRIKLTKEIPFIDELYL